MCLKQTLDPEIAPKDFKIDLATHKPIQGSTKLVLDSYAENALEAAIQLKEKTGARVTVLTVGDKPADEALRRGLALNADDALRVWDPFLTDLDAPAVAYLLAKAVAALGGADLILTGRQAADVERGSVGPMLAGELGVACVTFVAQVEPRGDKVRLTREAEGGHEVVESRLPAVLTVTSHESNVPRLPKVKDTMMAMRKPIAVKSADDLNVEATRLLPRVSVIQLFVPEQQGECEIIAGDDGAAKAAILVAKLQERKVM